MRRLSPIAAVVFLSGIALAPEDTSDRLTIETLRQRMKTVLAQIPDRLGVSTSWWMVDEVPVPTEAKMLDLNASVSRLYYMLGSDSAGQMTLFISHAKDARSMAGHHPPNCYPSQGWSFNPEETVEFVVPVAEGRQIKAALHVFHRGESGRSMRVVNGFLTPDGRGVAHLDETSSIMGRATTSRLGLIQYQLVFYSDLENEFVIHCAGDILSSLPAEVYEKYGESEILGGGR